jgi:predicted nucleic acid-binding protein
MKNIVVVDTSIAIKWIIEETDSEKAIALLNQWVIGKTVILAPVLLAYELTNVLHQRIRRGEANQEEAEQLLIYVLLNLVRLDTSYDYAQSVRALRFAQQHSLSATYDAHYLALAEREQCEYWTADARLLNGLRGQLSWVRNLSDHQIDGTEGE